MLAECYYLLCPFADDATVLTVGTEENDGLLRFLRSAKVYDIDVEVLGKGETWNGGDMNFAGGGQKVNFLKEKLAELIKTKDKDHIVLFTDRSGLIIRLTEPSSLCDVRSF